jgi:anti-sigma factor RsiW
MANLLACPGPDQLKSIALGVMPERDAEALIQHLEQCATCATRMGAIVAEDTLVEAVRAKETVGDSKPASRLPPRGKSARSGSGRQGRGGPDAG